MDINTLKERIGKLPHDKQRPFIEAMEKLNEIGQLKNEMNRKKENLSKEASELSRKADMLVKKELFPRVHIQIGPIRINVEQQYEKGIRLKSSHDGKNIDFANI